MIGHVLTTVGVIPKVWPVNFGKEETPLQLSTSDASKSVPVIFATQSAVSAILAQLSVPQSSLQVLLVM